MSVSVIFIIRRVDRCQKTIVKTTRKRQQKRNTKNENKNEHENEAENKTEPKTKTRKKKNWEMKMPPRRFKTSTVASVAQPLRAVLNAQLWQTISSDWLARASGWRKRSEAPKNCNSCLQPATAARGTRRTKYARKTRRQVPLWDLIIS